MELRW